MISRERKGMELCDGVTGEENRWWRANEIMMLLLLKWRRRVDM